jgi:FkbM family methyltransferase
MVFFDIGANMGYYTLIAAKKVGPTGRVDSFEPSPRMFNELKFNLELNKFNNVHINNIALGDEPGVARLSRYDRGREVYGSLSTRSFPGATIIGYDEVALETLDNYMVKKGIKQVDMIKMDVEGAEFLVLKGAVFFKLFTPHNYFELADINAVGLGSNAEEFWISLEH